MSPRSGKKRFVAYTGALLFSGLVWIGVIILVRSLTASPSNDVDEAGRVSSPVEVTSEKPVSEMRRAGRTRTTTPEPELSPR